MERSLHPRVSAVDLSAPNSPVVHQRPSPTTRSTLQLPNYKHHAGPRLKPLLHSAAATPFNPIPHLQIAMNGRPENRATLCGMPLKYISLLTLAVQNAACAIVMHYSRVSTPAHLSYSPALAVLLNEIFKGLISFVIAYYRVWKDASETSWSRRPNSPLPHLIDEIFSPDCWKMSIPAILYVIQNSLQFVAISNLPVATFQISYQMKILTTAAFSVVLLRKKLSSTKWLSLSFLAIGVGIVQIQSTAARAAPNAEVGSAHDSAPFHLHLMSPIKGIAAVAAACFTSGLAGVYFEMVLKNSKADLWVRNVQLSLFSLAPALLPVIYSRSQPNSQGFLFGLFNHFGPWAWGTVFIQVFGGLITAVVIKYSDNILKGFATSLSIILSFLASVALFDFRITPSFILGATTVLVATWMYNQPGKEPISGGSASSTASSALNTPISTNGPILGQLPTRQKSLLFGYPLVTDSKEQYMSEVYDTARFSHAQYNSPYHSRSPTPTTPS